ncbi:MAG TPA: HWE histidine kinase domain-containing protein [Microvirga sp.]|nr:HWE histidine kinase domain-containing protein [Microvirga sp.]
MPDTLETSLRIAVDSLPAPAWVADADGRLTHVNGSWTATIGLDAPALREHGWTQAAAAEEREALAGAWAGALRAGTPFDAEARLGGSGDGMRWHRVRAAPVRDGHGRIAGWLGTCTDIEAERSLEETRQALAREMNHRVKNLFAVASGLVSMTARSAKTPKDMADALRGRLGALSRAHELVRSSGAAAGQGASLGELIRAVLAPYAQEGPGDRLVLQGPAVPVGASVVTNLALVLHELSTNAAKYGALSSPRGHLAVRWSEEGEEVHLTWEETGGPALPGAPPAEGFGGQLTRRTVSGQLGGEMDYDWRADGLVLRMTLARDRLAR